MQWLWGFQGLQVEEERGRGTEDGRGDQATTTPMETISSRRPESRGTEEDKETKTTEMPEGGNVRKKRKVISPLGGTETLREAVNNLPSELETSGVLDDE